MFTRLLLALSLAAGIAHAQTTIPANTVPLGSGATLCQEPSCVIVSVSSPAVALYFGTGTSGWCAVPMVLTTLPLTVNDSSFNAALCPVDPAQGSLKQVVAMEQATSSTVTYAINGVTQPVFTVPALPPPPVTTFATTCSTTMNPTTGMISITLNATPSN